MPVVGSAIAGAIGITSAIGIAAVTAVVQIAASVGLSYLARSLEKKAPEDATGSGGTSGKISGGGVVPRSFIVGEWAVAGSLAYHNTYGLVDKTPNAYYVRVISLSDLPVTSMVGLLVNGVACTYNPGATPGPYGIAIPEYTVEGVEHLWVRFYNGTQVAADATLVSLFPSGDRAYGSDRIGAGVAYAVVTALVEDKLFTGFPDYTFVLHGIKLYDIRKDTSVGGSGAHRWATPSTWEFSYNPAVILYNFIRGVSYGGAWFYGLQTATAASLPISVWAAGMNECDLNVVNADTTTQEQFYAGGEIVVSTEPADEFEAFLKSCNGRVAEIGGTYKLHVGAATTAVLAFTDADVLSSEASTFQPFRSLEQTVNAITAKYVEPAEAWSPKDAPPRYRPDLETEDGGRRVAADVDYGRVSSGTQVQRLMTAALEEARRARTHVLPMPPVCWLVEPLDFVSWTSVRNGYEAKLFRVDRIEDRENLDVTWTLTEVDPADYDYDSGVDELPAVAGSITMVRPEPQPIVDFSAEGIRKSTPSGREVACIRLHWNPDVEDVDGVQWEVVLASDLSTVYQGQTDFWDAGAIDISQNIVGATAYKVRAKYRPHSARDTDWSGYLDVTTPDTRVTFGELEAQVRFELDLITNNSEGSLAAGLLAGREALQRAAAASADVAATAYLARKDIIVKARERATSTFAKIIREDIIQTDVNSAVAQTLIELAAAVTGSADVGSHVFKQATAPAALAVGDLWFDTSTSANIPNYWDGSAWVPLRDAQILNNAAAITAEQTARADAVSALASDIVVLSASTQGIQGLADLSDLLQRASAAGADVAALAYLARRAIKQAADESKTLASATIIVERIARTDAVSAVAQLISLLQVDMANASASILTEATARVTGDSANATLITALNVALASEAATRAAAVIVLQTADVTEASARASAITTVTASLTTETSDRTSADAANAAAIATEVTTRSAAVTTLQAVDVTEAATRATAITSVQASVTTEATNRATADATEVTNRTAAVTTEQTARVAGDTANASAITALTSTVGGNTADIATEVSTRISEDSAIVALVTAAQASADQATASGLIKLDVVAHPGDATASFGIFLKATVPGSYDAQAAFYMDVLSGGGTRILFNADRFYIYTSTSNELAFAVSGGVTYLGANVVAQNIKADSIDTAQLKIGGVITNRVADGAITSVVPAYNAAQVVFSGSSASVVESEIMSAVLTTANPGSSILVKGQCGYSDIVGSLTLYSVVLQVDGVDIPNAGVSIFYAAQGFVSVFGKMTSVAGTHTYRMIVRFSPPSAANYDFRYSSRYIEVSEMKK